LIFLLIWEVWVNIGSIEGDKNPSTQCDEARSLCAPFCPMLCSVLRSGNEKIEQVQSGVFLNENEPEKINVQ